MLLEERFGVSQRRACGVVREPHSTQRLTPPRPCDEEERLWVLLRNFAKRRPPWS